LLSRNLFVFSILGLESELPHTGEDDCLQIFGITRTGLCAISLAVVALWGCIALEQNELHHGRLDARASLRELNRLRERAVPASAPVSPFHHKQTPSAS
jgi:hypothetical protein